MHAEVPGLRFPFQLDLLIAEAKRRARQRRLLLAALLLVAALAAVAGFALGSPGSGGPATGLSRQAGARQPAAWADIDKMSSALTGLVPASGTYVGVAWLASTNPTVGLVLLYPGRLLKQVQPTPPGESQPRLTSGNVTFIAPPTLPPKAAEPVAAYLLRNHFRPRIWPWSVLAETLLRGPSVNKAQLADFCSAGKGFAPSLLDPYCR